MSEEYYDLEMARGAKYGDIELVKRMLEKGANNYKWAIKLATSYGHIEILKLLLIGSKIEENRKMEYRAIMLIAAENGQMEIVRLMCELGADNYDASYLLAVENGYIEIAQMMSERCVKTNILRRRSSF